MKQFKGLIAIFAVLMIIFTSCQKTDSIDPSFDDLDVVSDFASITSGTRGDSTDSTKHKCHINITQIDIATLPTSITSYITTNYAGSTINVAGTDSLGNFYIKVTKADRTHVGLLFDANGNFVKELKRGMKGNRGTEIAISSLSSSITSYITTNYSTATIKKAIQLTDGSFVVVIEQADGTYLGLAFDANGTFLSTVSVRDKHGRKKGRRK